MAFADLGEVQMFFTDEGTGDPPLVFVHGYTCDSHDWSWQLPHFTQEHRVLAVDLRGHGRSSAPPDGYSPEELASDVAALLESLHVARVVAVGHSLGGAVVSALAVEYPDLVAALVCVDPAYLLPDDTGVNAAPMITALNEMDPAPRRAAALRGVRVAGAGPRASHLAAATGRRYARPRAPAGFRVLGQRADAGVEQRTVSGAPFLSGPELLCRSRTGGGGRSCLRRRAIPGDRVGRRKPLAPSGASVGIQRARRCLDRIARTDLRGSAVLTGRDRPRRTAPGSSSAIASP